MAAFPRRPAGGSPHLSAAGVAAIERLNARAEVLLRAQVQTQAGRRRGARLDQEGMAPAANSANASPAAALALTEHMLNTVGERLALTLDDRATADSRSRTDQPAEGIADVIAECLAALVLLRRTLAREAERSARLEVQFEQAHAALAQARIELTGTRIDQERARHLALHDPLTNLPNRSHFYERLEEELARAAPAGAAFAVFYIDLDGFKRINDLHGHAVGDSVLKLVAIRLARGVRSRDLVSRLGGDEFACLLVDIDDPVQLRDRAATLFAAVASPLSVAGVTLEIRPSIGIATCPADGAGAEVLLRNADAAMYRAKAEQSRYAFYGPHCEP